MAILLNNGEFDNQQWLDAFAEHLPNETIHVYPNIPDKNTIEYAAVWNHPVGDLATYPNLKAILILGAGADFLLKDNHLPNIPIVRLIDDNVVRDMAQYCWYWVTHFYRHFDTYRTNQELNHWQRITYPTIENFKVGMIGLGAIGKKVGLTLADAGYNVSAWVQSAREVEDITLYIGEDEFESFMGELDVLINVLPLNQTTSNFLNYKRLSLLPKGAKVINISRGAVIDEVAIKCLLDDNHLGGAVLDVFTKEPLPADSWHWHHPKVNVTPHASGQTFARSAIKSLVANIKRIEKGEQPFPIFIPERGY
jgi:glyoxylate/hydroxypyruvate reductase A